MDNLPSRVFSGAHRDDDAGKNSLGPTPYGPEGGNQDFWSGARQDPARIKSRQWWPSSKFTQGEPHQSRI